MNQTISKIISEFNERSKVEWWRHQLLSNKVNLDLGISKKLASETAAATISPHESPLRAPFVPSGGLCPSSVPHSLSLTLTGHKVNGSNLFKEWLLREGTDGDEGGLIRLNRLHHHHHHFYLPSDSLV